MMRKNGIKRNPRTAAILRLTAVVLLALTVAAVFALFRDTFACKRVLRREGVEGVSCRVRGEVLYLVSEAGPEGVFAVRDALSALRRAGILPETAEWSVGAGETSVSRRITRADRPIPSVTPRVETLTAEMTELKVKYALQQRHLTAQVTARTTEEGKILRVTLQAAPEDLNKAAAPLRAVIDAVNEEGGGVLRYDVSFAENGAAFAALSVDLTYGDAVFSAALSAFAEE